MLQCAPRRSLLIVKYTAYSPNSYPRFYTHTFVSYFFELAEDAEVLADKIIYVVERMIQMQTAGKGRLVGVQIYPRQYSLEAEEPKAVQRLQIRMACKRKFREAEEEYRRQEAENQGR